MMMRALRTNSVTFICCVMLQVDSSCKSIGIWNLEWAVLPPRSSKDVIPDEATISTILLCPHRRDRSVNSLPSLFVTAFKIVSYALR
ncbi:hypothetical protein CY35_04G004600 [Sphagnum magellanicum]|nr:hypothetical protein CY35_04G004600 [Sphagnum magellanicum]